MRNQKQSHIKAKPGGYLHILRQHLTSMAAIISLNRGAANILKAVIPSTTRGTDSQQMHTLSL